MEAPSLEIGFWTTREYNLSEVANGRMHTSLLFTFSMDVKRPYSFLAPEHPGDYLINAYTTSSGMVLICLCKRRQNTSTAYISIMRLLD